MWDFCRKYVYMLLIGIFRSLWFLQTSFAFDFDSYIDAEPYGQFMDSTAIVDENNIDPGKILADEIKKDDGVLKQILGILGIDTSASDLWAFSWIRNLINYALVIVGLVAMAVLIYGFYKIFFTDWEEALKDAKKLIIWAAVALAIIGLARFITRFFFSVFETATESI